MTILVDENIPGRTVRDLRAQGHTVIDLRETADRAAAADRVWRLAQGQQAVLVTTDKGFIRRRQPGH